MQYDPYERFQDEKLAALFDDYDNDRSHHNIMQKGGLSSADVLSAEEHAQGKRFNENVSELITIVLVGIGFLTLVSSTCGLVGKRDGIVTMISITILGVIHHIIFDVFMSNSLYSLPVEAKVTATRIENKGSQQRAAEEMLQPMYFTDVTYSVDNKKYTATLKRRTASDEGKRLICRADPLDPRDIVEKGAAERRCISNLILICVTGALLTYIMINAL